MDSQKISLSIETRNTILTQGKFIRWVKVKHKGYQQSAWIQQPEKKENVRKSKTNGL